MLKEPQKKSPILWITLTLFLSACASSQTPLTIDQDMDCAAISAEIEQTRAALYDSKTTKTGNGSQVADTAAKVGTIGASMAGVPYVGGIYTIGKTLFNHRKQTAVNQADLLQYKMDELEYLSQQKLCDR